MRSTAVHSKIVSNLRKRYKLKTRYERLRELLAEARAPSICTHHHGAKQTVTAVQLEPSSANDETFVFGDDEVLEVLDDTLERQCGCNEQGLHGGPIRRCAARIDMVSFVETSGSWVDMIFTVSQP